MMSNVENGPRDNLTRFLLQVAAVLDVMGEASAKAQGLKTAITSGICQKVSEIKETPEKTKNASCHGGAVGRESQTSLRRLSFLSNYPPTLPTKIFRPWPGKFIARN